MKILKNIGIILLIIIAIACIYAAFLPSTYSVERSIVINSDEATVWSGINKFSSFKLWDPWLKRDPNAKLDIKGEDGAVGAVFSWDSEVKDLGSGSMTIDKVEPMHLNSYILEFTKPWQSKSGSTMQMDKAEGGYKVTWISTGDQGFMQRLFMLPMGGMDGAIGKDFEEGLMKLKELCENGTIKGTEPEMANAYPVLDIDFPKTTYAMVRSKVAFADIQKYFATNFGKIMEGSAKAGLKPSGVPSGIYFMYDDKAMIADMAAAMPMDKEAKINGVEWLTIDGKKAHQINYMGDYKNMMPAYKSMSDYLKANNLGDNPELVIEQYVTDPMTEKDTAKWQTNIVFFTK